MSKGRQALYALRASLSLVKAAEKHIERKSTLPLFLLESIERNPNENIDWHLRNGCPPGIAASTARLAFISLRDKALIEEHSSSVDGKLHRLTEDGRKYLAVMLEKLEPLLDRNGEVAG